MSEWLHFSGSGGDQSNQYLEGNPLDRAILAAVMVVGLIVLVRRGARVWTTLRANIPILSYFIYCGLSSSWSDFPDVSLKRWFRALGDVVMILIVLTDSNWFVAVRRLLTRVGFWVIPVSALFIRYFPELGRSYSRGGQASWTGVGTDKNALGIICAVFGLAAIYFFLQYYRDRQRERRRRHLIAYGIVSSLAFFLLWQSNSATAFACFFLAGALMVMTLFFTWARKPIFLHLSIALAVLIPFSAMFLGVGTGLVENLGRNATFTGRTAIWRAALSQVSNPLIGEGYESFWLGTRLTEVERLINQGLNQAHNGYLEVYLNLGWVGIALLGSVLISGYRRVTSAAGSQTTGASLRLAYFVVAMAYNFSEGGFKMMHPVWISLLLALAITPEMSAPSAEEINSEANSVSPPLNKTAIRGRQGNDKMQRAPRPVGTLDRAQKPMRLSSWGPSTLDGAW